MATGYFFHPAGSRAVNMQKFITQVSTNTYQVSLGDLANYSFQFDVDATNHLVNWVALENTPVSPSSGFMTTDNPGGYSYYPGSTQGFDDSTYNNTYDPATKTFYLHYGYEVGSAGEPGYARQLYEKYVLLSPPLITSFSPGSGTAGTVVTITGQNISDVNYIRFGSFYGSCDTFYVVNDTTVIAVVGAFASGKLYLSNPAGTDSSATVFDYTPPAVSNKEWKYLGSAGFSLNAPYSDPVMALTTNNIPYVVYTDPDDGKLIVKRYEEGVWADAGTNIAADSSLYPNIAIGNANEPYLVYKDLAHNGYVTVKKLSGNTWTNVGMPGFAYTPAYGNNLDIALDRDNNPYVITDSASDVQVYRFDGTQWINLGFIATGSDYGLAVDTITNTPYVVFDDFSSYRLSVMKYNNNGFWEFVGNRDFSVNNAFHPTIAIDKIGTPVVALQEDDGFERLSVYKLNGSQWEYDGAPKFSKNHSHWVSLAFTKNNLPVVAFTSSSFNQDGSVMNLTTGNAWDFVGKRGFAPLYSIQKKALAIDSNDVAYLVFRDELNDNKVSVMKYETSVGTNILQMCLTGSIIITSDITGSIYQWQVDEGNGFIDISDNAFYSGTNSQSLQLTGIPSSWNGFKYKCIADGKPSVISAIHVGNEWTGAADSLWENTANWSCGVLPDADTDVIFNSGDTVVLNSTVTIRSLKLNPSVSFTVAEGGVLTVVH